MSAPRFSPADADTLRQCGWKVAQGSASRKAGNVTAWVSATGQWRVVRRWCGELASGRASHPCYAAMDANEVFWATPEYIATRPHHVFNQEATHAAL